MEGPSGGWGKWSRLGVPHKGWTCVDIDPLPEGETTICEMCERTEIRFVHYMEHPEYGETLLCGCVCAGHMEEDLIGAKRRETSVRNALARKSRWLGRKGWRRSRKGNPFIRVDGYHITVYSQGSGYKAVISRPATDFKYFGRRTFPTEDSARLATFDALEFLKSK